MGKAEYPPDHKPGMRVPHGGSSCSSCRFLAENKVDCKNKYFIKWHGSARIPGKVEEYCSDWYEPRRNAMGKARERASAL